MRDLWPPARVRLRTPRLELRLPGEETEDIRVLILTTFDLDEYVYAALRAGASGFLLKDTPPNDLLAGIRAAAGDRVPPAGQELIPLVNSLFLIW